MRLRSIIVLCAGLTLAAPTLAHADIPTPEAAELVQLIDAGDDVLVDIAGATAVDAPPRFRQGRIEIRLAAPPAGTPIVRSDDPTIKRVALVGGSKPRVVLVADGPTLGSSLIQFIALEQTPTGLRIRIPRKPGAKLPLIQAVKAEPSHEAAGVVQPVSVPAVSDKPSTAARVSDSSAAPKNAAVQPEADTAATPAQPQATLLPADAAAQRAIDGLAAAPTAPEQAPETPSRAWLSWMWIVVALAGGGAWIWSSRRRSAPALPHDLKVLASQAVTPRSRVVLLGTGNRRFLVAANDKEVRLLEGWSDEENIGGEVDPAAAALAEAWRNAGNPEPPADAKTDTYDATGQRRAASSPSVAGILKLRRNAAVEGESTPKPESRWSFR